MMESFFRTDWGTLFNIMLLTNTVGEWFMAIGVMLATMIGLNLAQRWLTRVIVIPPKGVSASPIRRLIARIIARTHMVFLCGIGLFAGAEMLIMPSSVSRIFASIALIVTIIQVAIWASQVISVAIAYYTETRMETDKDGVTTVNILSLIARAVVWVVAILMVLSNMGVNITAFVASLGIGGVAIALASQKLLGDFFSGITIMLDRPFGIGDYVVFGEHSGTVIQIGIKSTRIRCQTGEDLIVSNSKLLEDTIKNHHGIETRRTTLVVQVQHGTHPDVVDGIAPMLANIVTSDEMLELVRARCTDITLDGIVFSLVYKVKSGDYDTYAKANETVLLGIYRLFHEQKISLARPLRVMEMGNNAPAATATATTP